MEQDADDNLSSPNQRWSLDFVSDQLKNCRRFRILAVVDDFTRECLALVADTSLSGVRTARELDAIISRRGKPLSVVSDNGTELTSTAILNWCQEAGVEWHYIAPGKPTQNAFVESFNGKPSLRRDARCHRDRHGKRQRNDGDRQSREDVLAEMPGVITVPKGGGDLGPVKVCRGKAVGH